MKAAMNVFWAKGFDSTTYGDLEAATGLRRQSLVYAFGDKRTMFEKTLQLYCGSHIEGVVGQLKAPGSPLGNVRRVFDIWLEDAANDAHPGCFLVNTAGEFGSSDQTYARIVEQSAERLVGAFEIAFRNAQKAGELAPELDSSNLARLAVSAGDGALLHSRVRSDSAVAAQTFQAFLDLLG